jgi:hypothetical protein
MIADALCLAATPVCAGKSVFCGCELYGEIMSIICFVRTLNLCAVLCVLVSRCILCSAGVSFTVKLCRSLLCPYFESVCGVVRACVALYTVKFVRACVALYTVKFQMPSPHSHDNLKNERNGN